MTAAPLPHIRQELQILEAPRANDGAPRWFIFDPIRNAFHMIGASGLTLLKNWQAGPIESLLARVKPHGLSQTDILAMSDFLYAQQLTLEPPGGRSDNYADREAAKRRPFYEILIHKYLFFRIPLFAPDKFLRKTYPFIASLFSKYTLIFSAVLGLIGLYFALAQWDQFIRTFWHFFTLEGFLFYVLALAVIKSCHELGHAFIAHHFGARVPTLGIAFLVMFPILYTDTTDAWRLLDKRQRLLIDGGGMIIELMIACLSIFLWAFLPDGPLRSLAFFAATTSWAFSLLVNLNPCMRFDGYYLISDAFGVQNLQQTGFELGRWNMREVLFKRGVDKPHAADGLRLFGFLSYAYTTWVYRFFLFIGIALLVHHLFPKAIGIILFSIEIIFFIIRPIWAELKNWWSFKMDIVSHVRGRLTLAMVLLAIIVMLWPHQRYINAPARIEPAQHSDIFTPLSARLIKIHVDNDMMVQQGDLLFELQSPALDFEIAQSRARLSLLEAQLSRRSSNLFERRSGSLLEDENRRELTRLKGLKAQTERLTIRAPQEGRISDLSGRLHEGRAVMATARLARISSPQKTVLSALAPEQDAADIKAGAKLKFIANDPALPAIKTTLNNLAPVGKASIQNAELTSQYGGKIAVHPEKDAGLIPVNPVYEVRANLPFIEDFKGRTIIGIARIKAGRQSYAARIGRQILRVLIREGDF